MFMGYPQNVPDNVYPLFNVKIKRLIKSKGLICLDKDKESLDSNKQDNESGF
jgi:hypothetical protein